MCDTYGVEMFGYIKAHVPELKVKEKDFYNAVYCGLCRSMGRRHRLFSFSLSYDFVFLALMRMSVSDEKPEFGKTRCIAHPFKKRLYLKENSALTYAASSAALLLYCKLLDDIADSKKTKKALLSVFLPSAKKLARKKCESDQLEQDVRNDLERLSETEKNGAVSVYVPAEIFGSLLGKIFSFGLDPVPLARCFYEFGFHIGKWIYIIDALDDIDSDLKTGNYNPFIVSGEYNKEGFAQTIEAAMNLELSDAEKALVLIEFADRGLLSIVQNIIYFGMPKEVKRVLSKINSKAEEITINQEKSV